MFELTDIPEIDPRVILNEEFEDWAILFQPLTGEVAGLDSAGVMTWKLIDGKRSGEAIAAALGSHFEDVPPSVLEDTRDFLQNLYRRLFVQVEAKDKR